MASYSRQIFLRSFLDARMENFLRGHVAQTPRQWNSRRGARELLQAFKRTGRNYATLSTEAARMLNASARMMDSYQHAMLTLERMRNGGKQTVVVQHVNVADGGQAVVAGQVKAKTPRRLRGEGQ